MLNGIIKTESSHHEIIGMKHIQLVTLSLAYEKNVL